MLAWASCNSLRNGGTMIKQEPYMMRATDLYTLLLCTIIRMPTYQTLWQAQIILIEVVQASMKSYSHMSMIEQLQLVAVTYELHIFPRFLRRSARTANIISWTSPRFFTALRCCTLSCRSLRSYSFVSLFQRAIPLPLSPLCSLSAFPQAAAQDS